MNQLAVARGIRNNNPGNIRRSTDPWQGLAADQTDPDFFVFEDATHGVRALARVLYNYQAMHGLRTLSQLIDRWAPPSENDTGAYVADVSKRSGLEPNAVLNLGDEETLRRLTVAIIAHENGGYAYPDVVGEGVRRALQP